MVCATCCLMSCRQQSALSTRDSHSWRQAGTDTQHGEQADCMPELCVCVMYEGGCCSGCAGGCQSVRRAPGVRRQEKVPTHMWNQAGAYTHHGEQMLGATVLHPSGPLLTTSAHGAQGRVVIVCSSVVTHQDIKLCWQSAITQAVLSWYKQLW